MAISDNEIISSPQTDVAVPQQRAQQNCALFACSGNEKGHAGSPDMP
jgi:hypothetical protein